MAVTTTPRFGITRWSAGADPFNRLQMDGSHEAIEDLGAIYLQGTEASRPAAGTEGRFYYATDTLTFFYDDGIGWRNVTNPDTVLLDKVQTLTNKTLTSPAINGTVTGTGTTYSGVTGITTPEYVQFDTSHAQSNAVAKLLWNDTDGTFNVGLKGGNVVLQVGQEMVVRVRNETGGTLANGKVVYVSGGLVDRKLVDYADASDGAKSDKAFGVLTESIADGQEGFATVLGTVRGVNTNGIAVGTPVWLSATNPGDMVTSRPAAPNHAVFIGWVTRSDATDGEIWVNVDNGEHLEYLHDVSLSTPGEGDILRYNNSTGLWENANYSVTPLANPLLSGTIGGNVYVSGTWETSGSGQFIGLGAITVCTSSTRPGSPSEGQIIYETDTDKVLAWDGSAWNPVSGAASYQTTEPSNPNVGSIWIDSDAVGTHLNTNDFLLKTEAAVTYATKDEVTNAKFDTFLLMGA